MSFKYATQFKLQTFLSWYTINFASTSKNETARKLYFAETVPCKQLKFLIKAYILNLQLMYPLCQDSLPSNITCFFRNAPKYQFHLLGSSRSSLLKVKRPGSERQIEKKKKINVECHFSPCISPKRNKEKDC